MLTFNNGHRTFKAFCSAVQEVDTRELRCTLTSSKDKGNHEKVEGIVNFIEALQAVIKRSEGDEALGLCARLVFRWLGMFWVHTYQVMVR